MKCGTMTCGLKKFKDQRPLFRLLWLSDTRHKRSFTLTLMLTSCNWSDKLSVLIDKAFRFPKAPELSYSKKKSLRCIIMSFFTFWRNMRESSPKSNQSAKICWLRTLTIWNSNFIQVCLHWPGPQWTLTHISIMFTKDLTSSNSWSSTLTISLRIE